MPERFSNEQTYIVLIDKELALKRKSDRTKMSQDNSY